MRDAVRVGGVKKKGAEESKKERKKKKKGPKLRERK